MAAGSTYTPIATNTLGSTQQTVTFSSISGSYTDLVLVCNFGTSGVTNAGMRLNSDTGTNYSLTYLEGNGTSATSGRATNDSRINFTSASWYASTGFANIITVNFNNYSNTTTYKTMLSRNGAADRGTMASAGLWRNTAAITSIQVYVDSGITFPIGSTFTLYGIQAA
jgi:hypothetical protein